MLNCIIDLLHSKKIRSSPYAVCSCKDYSKILSRWKILLIWKQRSEEMSLLLNTHTVTWKIKWKVLHIRQWVVSYKHKKLDKSSVKYHDKKIKVFFLTSQMYLLWTNLIKFKHFLYVECVLITADLTVFFDNVL